MATRTDKTPIDFPLPLLSCELCNEKVISSEIRSAIIPCDTMEDIYSCCPRCSWSLSAKRFSRFAKTATYAVPFGAISLLTILGGLDDNPFGVLKLALPWILIFSGIVVASCVITAHVFNRKAKRYAVR